MKNRLVMSLVLCGAAFVATATCPAVAQDVDPLAPPEVLRPCRKSIPTRIANGKAYRVLKSTNTAAYGSAGIPEERQSAARITLC